MIKLVKVILPCTRQQKVDFYFWVENDNNPVAEYIYGVQEEEQNKLIDFLASVAVEGIPWHNQVQCKKIHKYKNQYELKRKPHRVAFHEIGSGATLVLTEAWRKQETSKKNDPHYARADRRWQAYLEQKDAKGA